MYRVHATKMRERGRMLLKPVPNIVIKSREELEAEGYDSDQVMETEEAMTEAGESTEEVEVPVQQATAAEETAIVVDVKPEKVDAMETTDTITVEPLSPSYLLTTFDFPAVEDEKRDDEEDAIYPSQMVHRQELLKSIWEARTETVASRSLVQEMPFEQREAILRTSDDMGLFDHLQQLYIYRRSKLSVPADGLSDTLFMPESFHLTGSVPLVPVPGRKRKVDELNLDMDGRRWFHPHFCQHAA